jgi:ADP-heptose:LPS heptosyltransferase
MVDASLGFDPALSVLANNLRASALLGCDGGGLEPRVFYTQQDLDAARTILEPARRDGRPVLTVVAAGSSGIAWLEERFAEVIAYAARQLGFAIFCTGTAREAAAIDRLRGLAAVETAFVGPQSVPAQTALFALSDLALAVDTGPMHLARAAGVPMVVLAGCWERPHVWLPIGLAHIAILQGPFRSRPGADYLMDDLSAAEVQGALAEMARRYPPDQAARSARAAAGLSNIDLRAR